MANAVYIVVYIGMCTLRCLNWVTVLYICYLCKSDKTVNSTGSATARVSTTLSQLPPLQPTLLLTWKEKSHSNMPTPFMPAPKPYNLLFIFACQQVLSTMLLIIHTSNFYLCPKSMTLVWITFIAFCMSPIIFTFVLGIFVLGIFVHRSVICFLEFVMPV